LPFASILANSVPNHVDCDNCLTALRERMVGLCQWQRRPALHVASAAARGRRSQGALAPSRTWHRHRSPLASHRRARAWWARPAPAGQRDARADGSPRVSGFPGDGGM